MDPVEYIKFLEGLSRAQLEDYLEGVWHEDITITREQEKLLAQHIKSKKLEDYAKLFLLLLALLAAVPEYEGPLLRIKEEIAAPVLPPEYDLIWITRQDDKVCPICAPLHGKIISDDLALLGIRTHPGCRCEIVQVPKIRRAMNKIRTLEAGAVRAISEGQKRILEVLAAPFGSPSRKDKLGQFLSKNTDFMIEIGDRRPLLYFHGFSPRARRMDKPMSIGVATATRIDEQGLWMRSELDESELSNRTWKAALEGKARASSGSVNYLERHDDVTGEVLVWPIAELSVFDSGDNRVPVSDDAVVLPLRALYDEHGITLPDYFEAGEDEKDEADQPTEAKRSFKMEDIKQAVAEALAAQKAEDAAKAAEKEAMRAEILKELEGEPKYRSTFNITGKVTGKDSPFAFRATHKEREEFSKDELEETDRFLYHLMRPMQAPAAMRVLEETEAAEGAGLIPTPMLNRISAIRDEISLVAAIGIQKMFTNSLTLSVPREDAAMAVFATIAEEGNYIANEPAFSAETVTVVKKGSMITATEELLEDSSLFEPYFASLCGRKWGLTENLILFTELKADDTAGTHSATFTQPEIDAFMFQIEDPWADGAHLIMAQATMANIRGLLIATPRAYGSFPEFGGLKYPTFFGYPTHLNSNWEAIGAGDTTLTMTLVNPAAMTWVERRGLSIKVDPYGDALAGRVRYFPSFRAACATTQVKGNVSYTDHA